MYRFVCFFVLLLSVFSVFAQPGTLLFPPVDINIYNQGTLQRGAKHFVNQCLSCHSSRYARYERLGEDIGLTNEEVEKNLIFTGRKIGDLMEVAMPGNLAEKWFGHVPPDLTLVARSRGPDWIYNYLKSFYLDDSRPNGINNVVLQHTAMPYVLWYLQGWQKPVYTTALDETGHERQFLVDFELVEPGVLTPEEYDKMVRDLVTFLVYMAEPAALEREELGYKVIGFLLLLFLMVYLLKREYWRDISP